MSTEAALIARGVTVVLGKKRVCQNIRLAVHFGEFQVIAGPNGAGKTTLLRVLLGLLQPSEGEVDCGGVAVQALPRVARARRLAYVPQRSLLQTALSVREVVEQGRYASRSCASSGACAVWSALQRVEMHDFADRNFLSLSGGERRLVLIARALATGAKVICLDEPSASLDLANRLRILSQLRSLAQEGHAILCVLHDLDDIKQFADKVVFLHRGCIVASGAPQDTITAKVIESIYGVILRPQAAFGFALKERS